MPLPTSFSLIFNKIQNELLSIDDRHGLVVDINQVEVNTDVIRTSMYYDNYLILKLFHVLQSSYLFSTTRRWRLLHRQ